MNEAALAIFVVVTVSGCHRSAVEVYCEEVGQCVDLISPGTVTQGAVDDCVDRINDDLDGLTEKERQEQEEPVEACRDEERCAFVVCMCDRGAITSALCDAAPKHL